jgi:YihY family inner membrane protein
MSKGDSVTSLTELGHRRIQLFRAIAGRLLPSLRYLFATEVHAYAFSIAANAYLSFFPFTLLLLTLCRRWLRWESAYRVILELLRIHLPAGAESIIRNLSQLAQARPRLQLISVVVLFFTSSGVFLPLEVALNQVWGIRRNRSFLKNQAMSFFLAVTTGLIAFLSILLSTAAQWVLTLTLGRILSRGLVAAVSRVVMETLSVPLAVSICFVIYFLLPNGPVPVIRVLPAAMISGVFTEVAKIIYMQTLPLFRFREVYGPFAVSATLLFWAYGAALILLFGAHFCAHGSFVPRGAGECSSDPASSFPNGDDRRFCQKFYESGVRDCERWRDQR